VQNVNRLSAIHEKLETAIRRSQAFHHHFNQLCLTA